MLTIRSACISERPAAKSGRAATKAESGYVLRATCRKFTPSRRSNSPGESPYSHAAALLHGGAQRGRSRRHHVGRVACGPRPALPRHTLSHDRRAGRDPAAHPHLGEPGSGEHAPGATWRRGRSDHLPGTQRGLIRCRRKRVALEAVGVRRKVRGYVIPVLAPSRRRGDIGVTRYRAFKIGDLFPDLGRRIVTVLAYVA